MIVVWRITTHCNLGCGFCAYAQDLPSPRVNVDADVVLRFARLLSEHQQRRGERVMISWLGGEPLLWKPIHRVSAYVSEKLDLQVSTTTNGTALKSDAMLQSIADHFAEITLSIDGPQPFHDAIRQCPRGFENLRFAVARLRELTRHRQRRLLVRVNTVLMADNVRLFASLCEELLKWDIDEITYNQLGGNDRPEFYRHHRLAAPDVEQLVQLLPDLRQTLQDHGVRLSGGPEYLRRFQASAIGQSLPVLDCHPGQRFLFVDEYGRIAPCSFTTAEYGQSIDDISTLADLDRLAARFSRLRMERRSHWCDDCPSTQVFTKFVA